MVEYIFSRPAKSLWAKLSEQDNTTLPLWLHLADTAIIAQKLWDNWLPPGVQNQIAAGIKITSNSGVDSSDSQITTNSDIDTWLCARQLLTFLAASHDLGKASPLFQLQKAADWLHSYILDSGLPDKRLDQSLRPHHSLISLEILERLGCDRSLSIVVGGHHGAAPDLQKIEYVQLNDTDGACDSHCGFDSPAWTTVHRELVEFAAKLAEINLNELKSLLINVPTQVLLTGLIIMADWIASDTDLFPYFRLNQIVTEYRLDTHLSRIDAALSKLTLPPHWTPTREWLSADIFALRFSSPSSSFYPRPLQQAIIDNFPNIHQPGIAVIEAAMGEGKTEAALAAAEIFASKTGRGGVFFALPTRATSDGLFPRLAKWISKLDNPDQELRSLLLAHGKSRFNEEYQGLPLTKINVGANDTDVTNKKHDQARDENVVVHEWFRGRKKAMLSGFVVGTVDQLLMAGLCRKHLPLLHLGLANKVLIIDECHAYDAYMSSYLFKALRWLGAYGVPVIVLSATLPTGKRRQIIDAYLGIKGKKRKDLEQKPAAVSSAETDSISQYPIISYSEGKDVHTIMPLSSRSSIEIGLESLADDELVSTLSALLQNGGCAGVIVNTVGRAQKLTQLLQDHFPVCLLHSRFLACDRARIELELRRQLGPVAGEERPQKLVVVGTQVLEQSLDIDFDLMVSDLCPIDLLIQRIGRLHRHTGRHRPAGLEQPRCFVTGSEGDVYAASVQVYDEYLLQATWRLLCQRQSLSIPDDIVGLVNTVYQTAEFAAEEKSGIDIEMLVKAHEKYQEDIAEQERDARNFQIFDPPKSQNDLTGWLTPKSDSSDKCAEATVRAGDPAVEVIVIWQDSNEKLYLLPWLATDHNLPLTVNLSDELASTIASCSVTLPRILCSKWMIKKLITELEIDNNNRIPATWQRSPWLKDELFLILDSNYATQLLEFRLKYDKYFGLISERQ